MEVYNGVAPNKFGGDAYDNLCISPPTFNRRALNYDRDYLCYLGISSGYFQSNRIISIKKEKERQVVFQNYDLGKEKNTVISGAFPYINI